MKHVLPFLPRTAVFALALFLLPSCGDEAIDGLAQPVDQPGPFAVGYRTITVTYTPPADVERTITVALWYPVDAKVVDSLPNAEYASYTIIRSRAAIVDAPLAPPAYDDGYPVLMHSHGATSFPGNSFLLAESFASHGWVVAAPTHYGDTISMPTEPVPLANRYERPLDISATLDALETLPAEDPLAGKLVTDRVVLSGHSRGTFTVWAAVGSVFDLSYVQGICDGGEYASAGGCPEAQIAAYGQSFKDDRIIAGIPMAGSGDYYWFGGAAGMNGVTVPILMMTGSADPVGAQTLFDTVTEPDMTWVDIAGGCHQLYGFGGCPGLSDAIGQPIVSAYALAFARYHLFGDTDETVVGLVNGSIVPSDLVTIKTR